MHGLAVALYYAALLAYIERSPAEVERLASDLIELSTRHGFAFWLHPASVFRAGRAALPAARRRSLVDRGRNRGASGERCGVCHVAFAIS